MPRLKHSVIVFAATIGYPILRRLPVGTAAALLALFVRRLSHVLLKRRTMSKNLARAFPERGKPEIEALMGKVAGSIGHLIAEVIHIPSFAAGRRGTAITTEGADPWLTGERGPAIFVGAHLGNWEVVPLLWGGQGHPMTILYSKIGIEAFDRRLLALRRQTGCTYVDKARGLRACIEAMKQGSSLALLMDQRVETGVEAEFFGEKMLFTHVPARLAIRFGCPVVVIEAIRQRPGHIHAFFHEPLVPGTERSAEAEQRLTQQIVTTIEAGIRRHPEQWLCNKRRWTRKRSAPQAGAGARTSDPRQPRDAVPAGSAAPERALPGRAV